MSWFARLLNRSSFKWLYFGLGVKRWLVLLFIGVTILGLGFAYVLVDIYRQVSLPDFFYYLTLQFVEITAGVAKHRTGGLVRQKRQQQVLQC